MTIPPVVTDGAAVATAIGVAAIWVRQGGLEATVKAVVDRVKRLEDLHLNGGKKG